MSTPDSSPQQFRKVVRSAGFFREARVFRFCEHCRVEDRLATGLHQTISPL